MHACIDYQKAFDIVVHSWINKPLVLIGMNNKIICFTKRAMSVWKASVGLHTEGRTIETKYI
jgi:hypothetical protein